jgi:hypothetical protein
MPFPRRVLPAILALLPATAWAEAVAIGNTGLSLPVPDGWHVDRTVPGTVAVLRSPAPDDLAAAPVGAQARGCGAIAVVLSALKPGETQGDFNQRSIQDLGTMLTDYDPHDRDFEHMIGAREFQFLAYHFRTGQIVWEQEMYVTAVKGQGVVVTCSSDAAHFDRWKSAMAASVAALGR